MFYSDPFNGKEIFTVMAVKVSNFRGHRLIHEPPAINDEDLLPSDPKKQKTLKEESLKARKEMMW